MRRDAIECHFPVADPDDPLHDADIRARALEHTPLLDVQLEIAGNAARRTLRFIDTIGIAAEQSDTIPDRAAAHGFEREIARRQATGHRLTSDQSTFLVLEVHDFERMPELHALLDEDSRDLERGERPERPVEPLAIRNGVGM